MNHLSRLHTYLRLGIPNLARVLFYKVGLKLGVHPAQKIKFEIASGPYFRASERTSSCPKANRAWGEHSLIRFGGVAS